MQKTERINQPLEPQDTTDLAVEYIKKKFGVIHNFLPTFFSLIFALSSAKLEINRFD